MAPRAFVSFEMEDRWARDFLVQHAKDEGTPVEFVDYSVKNPWDRAWKTQCKARIALTMGTIVLIGPTTWKSDAVKWEIDETERQGHYMFGVQTRRDLDYKVPAGLASAPVVRWNFSEIAAQLSGWR